jgi:hypothetical protein
MQKVSSVLVLQLLIFVLHVKSGQAGIAAFQEKDEEDHGEESASITFARCHKNSEKIKKRVQEKGKGVSMCLV